MPRSVNRVRLSQPTLFHPPHPRPPFQTFPQDIQEKAIRLLAQPPVWGFTTCNCAAFVPPGGCTAVGYIRRRWQRDVCATNAPGQTARCRPIEFPHARSA